MKIFIFVLSAPAFIASCGDSLKNNPASSVRADAKDRIVAYGEPYLRRDFDIIENSSDFDEFCAAEKKAGRIRTAQCADGLFRSCVSNAKGQWVIIPGEIGVSFLDTVDKPMILGADVIDRSLPPKKTLFHNPESVIK